MFKRCPILVGLHALGKSAGRLKGKREGKKNVFVHCIADGIMVEVGSGFITADTAAFQQAA